MLRPARVARPTRKLRLFAVACCRRIYHRLTDERLRDGLEAAERLADGAITEAEVTAHQENAYRIANARYTGDMRDLDMDAFAVGNALSRVAKGFANAIKDVAAMTIGAVYDPFERASQANLLREILGNPFLRCEYSPRVVDMDFAAVLKMAQIIYADRAFDRLPILADALEDAGCDNADILAHCRGPGPHVRGCWVVDLLLGKS